MSDRRFTFTTVFVPTAPREPAEPVAIVCPLIRIRNPVSSDPWREHSGWLIPVDREGPIEFRVCVPEDPCEKP